MQEYYLIKNAEGYLYDDEDHIGLSYGELGEQTLAFINKEDAEENAEPGDEIVSMGISESAKRQFIII